MMTVHPKAQDLNRLGYYYLDNNEISTAVEYI